MRHACSVAATVLVLSTGAAHAQTDRMFVTSASGPGNLSLWSQSGGLTGVAAGDKICETLAATFDAANASSYRAWLSDASSDAYCHVKGRSGHPPLCGSSPLASNPGPWARRDGQPFARSVAALTSGEVLTPPLLDEQGNAVPLGDLVWTGTNPDGTSTGFDCADTGGVAWHVTTGANGSLGNTSFTTAGWTYDPVETLLFCGGSARLYCFKSSSFGGPPFDGYEGAGALVFLTGTSHDGDLGASPDAAGLTGRDAGDAICRARAPAGGLPHPSSFHAWLSSATTNAIDLSTYDGPFKRPDGVGVASSKADLTDGELAAPINETELLGYGSGFAWTGTNDDGTGALELCRDWTYDGAAYTGQSGNVNAVSGWSAGSTPACVGAQPLYCISDTEMAFWSGFEEPGGGLWRWSGGSSP